MSECYLCTFPGDRPLSLGKEFTGHVLARSPRSECLCDRCADLVSPGGRLQYAWYWNSTKGAWSKIFTRNTSWLLINSRDLHDPRNRPYFGPVRDEGKGDAHELINMPSQADIRQWLLDPPDPPFEIAIADSGQKHILFLGQVAESRDLFPIQFELAQVWIDRAAFSRLLTAIETLLAAGFSKAEIATNSPRIDRLATLESMAVWDEQSQAIGPARGTSHFVIALKVAQRPEVSENVASPAVELPPEPAQMQLSLI